MLKMPSCASRIGAHVCPGWSRLYRGCRWPRHVVCNDLRVPTPTRVVGYVRVSTERPRRFRVRSGSTGRVRNC